ncbi:hypothetical protein CF326_g2081 [Tilletia indica]|nr:hypothetical protein CF326_g2081 [Tilletia indica]
MSSQSPFPPSTPTGSMFGAEATIGVNDGLSDGFGRSYSPSPSSRGSVADSPRVETQPNPYSFSHPPPFQFQAHSQLQAQMRHQADMLAHAQHQAQLHAQMHGYPPVPFPSGHTSPMGPPSTPLGLMQPSQGQNHQPSPIFVPTVAPKPVARRAEPVPSEKTLAKKVVNDVQLMARMDQQVQKWVKASIEGVKAELTGTLNNRVDLTLEKYTTVVQTFRAKVVRVDGRGEDLQRSDDGNVYLRINHANLETWFVSLSDVKREVDLKLAQMAADLAAMKLQVASLSSNTTRQGPVAGSSSNSAGRDLVAGPSTVRELDLKDHKWTAILAAFRALVYHQAGISLGRGAADRDVKIYELEYPASPNDIAYHPVTYVPTEGEVAAPESAAAEGGVRFRKLRLRFDLGYNETPNVEALLPILKVLVRDHRKYGLPATITTEVLMKDILFRTYDNWKDKYRSLHQPNKTIEECRQELVDANQAQRRKKRPATKGSRRYKAVQAVFKALPKLPDSSSFDVCQKILYHATVQSEEETDEEVSTSAIKTLRRSAPDFRSDELTDFLHGLDPVPALSSKFRYVDVEERTTTTSVPAGMFKWMVRAAYLARNPAVIDELLPNVGPFTGDHSVAVSADMFGSDSLALSSSHGLASTSTSSIAATTTGSGLDLAGGSDGMAVSARNELDAGLGMVQGTHSGLGVLFGDQMEFELP